MEQRHNSKKQKKQSLTGKAFYIATQTVLCAILFFTAGMLSDKGHAYVSEREDNEHLLHRLLHRA